MKNEICAAIGIVGGAIASLLGGWDTALQTLIITDGCAHPGGADSCCGRAEAAGGRKERQLTTAPGSLMVPRG